MILGMSKLDQIKRKVSYPAQRKMHQKILYRIKLFWQLLTLDSNYSLLKITNYVNWRLLPEHKIPLPKYIHIL